MKKISEAALKKAIRAAEAEQLKNPLAFRPDGKQQAALEKGRRESEAMVSAFLKEAGLDLTRFQALQEQRSVALERLVEQHRVDAVRRAATQKEALQSRLTVWTKVLPDLKYPVEPPPYRVYYLDRPFLVWSTPLHEMSDNTAETNRDWTWAKFKVATSQRRGPQRFGFYFYWVNPSSEYAVIKAETVLSAVGHLKSHAPWTLGVNTSWVEAWACLIVRLGSPSAVTPVQNICQPLGATGAFAQTFIGGETNGRSISAPYERLNTAEFPVPPGNVAIFEVALQLEYENDSGNIEADFQSGDFQIICPKLNVSVLNSPPGL